MWNVLEEPKRRFGKFFFNLLLVSRHTRLMTHLNFLSFRFQFVAHAIELDFCKFKKKDENLNNANYVNVITYSKLLNNRGLLWD